MVVLGVRGHLAVGSATYPGPSTQMIGVRPEEESLAMAGCATGDTPQTVLVTGASGALGPCIVRTLACAGLAVRVFSLHGRNREISFDGVQVKVGDITDALAVRDAMAGVDLVVHLAALLHVPNPIPALCEQYHHVNVDGTATVVAEALRAGVRRLVFCSTIGVYGETGGKIVDEDSGVNPETLYAKTKLAGESIVLEARRSDGQSMGTVLRLGAAYGTRMKGNYQRLLRNLARGWLVPLRGGHNRRTLVYDKDIARAVLLAIQHPVAGGRVYNVTDGSFHTVIEITEAICRALGRRTPRFSLPASLVRVGVGIVEDIAIKGGWRLPLGRSSIDTYMQDIAVLGDRIQEELAFRPSYGLAAGWQDTVSQLRERDDL